MYAKNKNKMTFMAGECTNTPNWGRIFSLYVTSGYSGWEFRLEYLPEASQIPVFSEEGMPRVRHCIVL